MQSAELLPSQFYCGIILDFKYTCTENEHFSKYTCTENEPYQRQKPVECPSQSRITRDILSNQYT